MSEPITLPADLRMKVEQEAEARGISATQFVCESLERAITQKPSEDPLFADKAVYRDEGPEDLAAHHDDYLYGDAS